MNRKNAFWKLVFLALALTLIFVLTILLLVWLRLDQNQKEVLEDIVYTHIYYFLALITAVPVALWVIFELCYTRFYLPLKKIPSETAVIYQTNPSYRLTLEGNQDIHNLSTTINQFAQRYENLSLHIGQQVTAAREQTERERNMLASIMAEIPIGLIICTRSGRILLFNSQAKLQFVHSTLQKRSEYFLGLGRSIFHLIDKDLITHALNEIEERLASGKKRVASYFTIQIQAGTFTLVETIPVLDQDREITGFILGLQDITASIERYAKIDTGLGQLHDAIYRFQREAERKNTTAHSWYQAVSALKEDIATISSVILEAAFEPMPLTKLELRSLLFNLQKEAACRSNIRINIVAESTEKRILGDNNSLVTALLFLVERLAEISTQSDFDLLVTAEKKNVQFTLSWGKHPVAQEKVHDILQSTITPITSLSYILQQNKASVQPVFDENDNCQKIEIITRAELPQPFPGKKRAAVIAGSRPEYYDFNLFNEDFDNPDLLERELHSLTYSVIDTETTGLNPSGGDEIIAIGAVRIVGCRIIHQESFEQLINPGRDIPVESYKIHGISSEQVAGMPSIEKVIVDLKSYISETIILGHDVAFDMKMLRMKEKLTGIVFHNPVLDTLLLSAMLHPVHRQHDIESIAQRLGVDIIDRHTALGDAVTTARIFLKLIPILQSKGIVTLQDAIKASKRTYFQRLRY